MDKNILPMDLIISCPLVNPHPDCPFTDLRKAPITRLMEIASKISKEEIRAMKKHHKKCLRQRIKDAKKAG